MQEKIIQTKQCAKCGNKFDITDKDLEFYKKVSPKFNGKVYEIPTPTLCPDCRQQRRLAWRNERKLYKRKCDMCGKHMISVYSPDKDYKVYCPDCWWGDKWDSLQYGQDFDFSKSFFEQFGQLLKNVPKLSISNADSTNSDYTHLAAYNKDCYFIVESSNNENCYYSYWLQLDKYVVDSVYVNNSEICYDCVDITKGFNLKYCDSCIDCANSYFLYDCKGCEYCFGCANLNNKKYYVFNKKVSKDEYNKLIKEFNESPTKRKELTKKALEFIQKQPKRANKITNSVNCSGDYILNSKDCYYVFEANGAENCRYSVDVWRNAKDCVDGNTNGIDASLMYETINCAINVNNILFSVLMWIDQSHCIYNFQCNFSSYLFGCVGLRNKKYCILNKQYTKEEYEQLVPKIIEHMKKTGEWGEFFPGKISPFGYNETVANEYYPLTKEEAIKQGFKWQDKEYPVNVPEGMPTMKAEELPESIADLTEEEEKKILNSAIICEISGKPYRITKQELDFYKKHNIPLPRKHPDVRHIERMKRKNPRKLYDRKCDKCGKDIKTTYAPDRPEIVYCQECYDKEVY